MEMGQPRIEVQRWWYLAWREVRTSR